MLSSFIYMHVSLNFLVFVLTGLTLLDYWIFQVLQYDGKCALEIIFSENRIVGLLYNLFLLLFRIHERHVIKEYLNLFIHIPLLLYLTFFLIVSNFSSMVFLLLLHHFAIVVSLDRRSSCQILLKF